MSTCLPNLTQKLLVDLIKATSTFVVVYSLKNPLPTKRAANKYEERTVFLIKTLTSDPLQNQL